MSESKDYELNPSEKIGTALKQARVENSFTVDYIEAQLKISIHKVEAIERGDFHAVGLETFVRGYIARYCRLVNLDPDEILSDFEMEPPEGHDFYIKINQDKPTFNERVKEKSGILLTVAIVLGVGVFLATLYLVWTPPELAPDTSSPNVEPALETVDSEQAGSGVIQVVPPATSEIIEEEVAGPTAIPDADPPPDVNIEPVEETIETPEPEVLETQDALDTDQPPEFPNTSNSTTIEDEVESETGSNEELGVDSTEVELPIPDRVQLTFSDRCFASIIDHTGKTLFIGMARSGQSLDLTGEAPFEIELGRAGVVKVTYQELDVPLGPHTRGGIAKLSVGP